MSELTICIPTYNRAEHLAECLHALIPQVRPHAIEICISDNGSSDATREVVARIRDEVYANIRYVASAQNDRIDRNILRVVSMASTRYAWIFGDDDRAAPGAVDRVLEALRTEPAVVYVNRSEWTTDMRRVVRERTMRLERDCEVTDPERLLTDFAYYITFVGALVVDVARWKRVDPAPYLDTDFVHVGIVHEYFQSGDRACVLAAPLIECRLGNATWSDRYFDVWFVNWPTALNRLPGRYGRASRVAAMRAILDGSMPTLMAARGNGRYGSRQFAEIIAPLYGAGDWRRVLALAVSGVPRPLARMVTRIQRRARQWDRRRTSRPIV